jgi:ribose 5-phosphate isomerase B
MNRRVFLQSAIAGSALPLVFGEPPVGLSQYALAAQTNSPTPTPQHAMNIVIAADPFALTLKEAIVAHLKEKGHTILDVGATQEKEIAYYDCAPIACKMLQSGEAEKAILFCGTGMGMSVIGNRFKGVVASVVESVFAARMCRAVNNANALCLGSMIWGDWMAKEAVDAFLETEFTQGLDGFADFLRDAEKKVDAIRP